MKRFMAVLLAAALVAALPGCAALAQEADQAAQSENVTLDPSVLFDVSMDVDDETALALDIDQTILPQSGDGEASTGLQPNPDAENSTVTKQYIVYEIKDGEATVVSAKKVISDAQIPESIKGYPVTRIAPRAFSGCKRLWSVKVPETVTSIGEYAFNNCRDLVKVILPESVSEIGPYAFRNCITISHIDLPEGLAEISQGMFENCQMLWRIAIPSSVKTIGESAFYRCLSLKKFTLPKGLADIGEGAFELCGSMKSVKIPAGISVIREDTFYGCTDLKRVTLPEGLVSIGVGAFFQCDSLREIVLPATLESIDQFAFAYCDDLKTLEIPAKVATVGYGAFFRCKQLQEVSVKSGVKQLDPYCFSQCRALKRVEIPESVEAIGENAFAVGDAAEIVDDGEILLETPLSIPKNLKLYGRPDSTVEQYAAENDIPFVIQKILATSVSIAEGKSATLYIGNTMQLTAVQKPSNAETTVSWKSSSSSVKVSKTGLLTPKHAGKATITVTTENGKTAKMIVKVVDAKSVTIDEGKTVKMKVGEELQLNATVLPEQVTTKLTWKSGNKRVATVSASGLVKAIKKGKATITVKTANGKKATIKVKVG